MEAALDSGCAIHLRFHHRWHEDLHLAGCSCKTEQRGSQGREAQRSSHTSESARKQSWPHASIPHQAPHPGPVGVPALLQLPRCLLHPQPAPGLRPPSLLPEEDEAHLNTGPCPTAAAVPSRPVLPHSMPALLKQAAGPLGPQICPCTHHVLLAPKARQGGVRRSAEAGEGAEAGSTKATSSHSPASEP